MSPATLEGELRHIVARVAQCRECLQVSRTKLAQLRDAKVALGDIYTSLLAAESLCEEVARGIDRVLVELKGG